MDWLIGLSSLNEGVWARERELHAHFNVRGAVGPHATSRHHLSMLGRKGSGCMRLRELRVARGIIRGSASSCFAFNVLCLLLTGEDGAA